LNQPRPPHVEGESLIPASGVAPINPKTEYHVPDLQNQVVNAGIAGIGQLQENIAINPNTISTDNLQGNWMNGNQNYNQAIFSNNLAGATGLANQANRAVASGIATSTNLTNPATAWPQAGLGGLNYGAASNQWATNQVAAEGLQNLANQAAFGLTSVGLGNLSNFGGLFPDGGLQQPLAGPYFNPFAPNIWRDQFFGAIPRKKRQPYSKH